MCLSAHSILGRGTAVANRRKSLATVYEKQDLNFLGHTWSTRWLLAVLPKYFYDNDVDAYDSIMQNLVDDMNTHLRDGVQSLRSETHWMVVLHVMGDWPFHQKTFHLLRSFANAAKAPSSRTEPKGICHNSHGRISRASSQDGGRQLELNRRLHETRLSFSCRTTPPGRPT